MNPELQLGPSTTLDLRIKRRVSVHGMEFDEDLLARLISRHMLESIASCRPTFSTAFEIYMHEHPSSGRKRFRETALLYYRYFIDLFGDLPLDELRHRHITEYRDFQLARGLSPESVRKHNNTLNAILNMAFKHLDIDRLSPFRGLRIRGEGECRRPIPAITPDSLDRVKTALQKFDAPYRLVALIQLNTGMRISEPAMARLDDCVLEHDIPHLWVRKNELTDRKTQASIRAVPLVGASLVAAKKLYSTAKLQGSDWLVPAYARENGNNSCSAAINKSLRSLNFRSHMFRHAFVDRLKACNEIPTKLAESITGHSRGGSDFDSYGSVGYSLEQKLAVIRKVEV